MKDTTPPQLPENKTFKTLKNFKEKTSLNMGYYDIERASKMLDRAHELFFRVEADRELNTLYLSISILRNVYISVRANIPKELSKKIDAEFLEIRQGIKNLGLSRGYNPKLPNDAFNSLLERSYELFRVFYEVKQKIGLGIPTERIRTDETKLADAMK